mmetsp:Transcript_100438/g.323823  ORF Transcript_100438/g.323823 Transcript_100438/m.323823 type:complete len:419 (+) Transcript_100438:806-2062(+)
MCSSKLTVACFSPLPSETSIKRASNDEAFASLDIKPLSAADSLSKGMILGSASKATPRKVPHGRRPEAARAQSPRLVPTSTYRTTGAPPRTKAAAAAWPNFQRTLSTSAEQSNCPKLRTFALMRWSLLISRMAMPQRHLWRPPANLAPKACPRGNPCKRCGCLKRPQPGSCQRSSPSNSGTKGRRPSSSKPWKASGNLSKIASGSHRRCISEKTSKCWSARRKAATTPELWAPFARAAAAQDRTPPSMLRDRSTFSAQRAPCSKGRPCASTSAMRRKGASTGAKSSPPGAEGPCSSSAAAARRKREISEKRLQAAAPTSSHATAASPLPSSAGRSKTSSGEAAVLPRPACTRSSRTLPMPPSAASCSARSNQPAQRPSRQSSFASSGRSQSKRSTPSTCRFLAFFASQAPKMGLFQTA